MATTSVFFSDSPRTVVLRPPTNVSTTCMVFEARPDRSTGTLRSMALLQPADTIDFSSLKMLLPRPVFGCLGVINSNGDLFIALAADASKVADIEGQPVYRLSRVAFYSLLSNKYDNIMPDPGTIATADEQQPSAAVVHPCQPLIKLLSAGSFYFSRTFDLTRHMDERLAMTFPSASENANAASGSGSPSSSPTPALAVSVIDTMDLDYVWNRNLLQPLLQFREQELAPEERDDFDLGGQLLPLIQGFVGLEALSTRSTPWQLGIISRLSCNRAGTRFNARGIDDDGNVSNFVETEFLIYNDKYWASHLQIRGSVPVFWEQTGMQMSHKITLSRGPESTVPAARKHFEELVRRYSKIQVMNLLAQSPAAAENSLSDAYRTALASLSPDLANAILYSSFDFNAIIKHDQYERLDDLLEQVGPALESFGYFMLDMQTKTPIFQRSGVFRTNCLDCLDRTNVVQTSFARRVLQLHLEKFGIRLGASELEYWTNTFNGLWADNGDWLSRIYAGTGALKSSYTRKGKLTVLGYLDDAAKSVNRFYNSNFLDKGRQDAIDMLFNSGRSASASGSLLMRNPVHEQVERIMEERKSEYAKASDLTILLGTYNLNGKMLQGESLDSWLVSSTGSSPTMIVIGVQELIELTAGRHYISADTNMLRLLWESMFLKAINSRPGGKYVVLRSLHLVALGMFIFVKENAVPYVRKVETAVIKTGLGGMAANKGGIGISLHFHDTSMVFVTAHFAAGTNAVEERNRDYWTITNGLAFRGRRVYEHDMVFWLGDFNYRINLSNEEARMYVSRKDLEALIRRDQLIEQIRLGQVFEGFTEGRLTFDPTYKYDNGTTEYDTSEKARVPSWTDRILFKGKHIGQLEYMRGEQVMSDHRPVRAVFTVQVNEINFKAREALYHSLLKSMLAEGGAASSRPAMIERSKMTQPAYPGSSAYTVSKGSVRSVSPGRGLIVSGGYSRQSNAATTTATAAAAAAVASPIPKTAATGTLIDLGGDDVSSAGGPSTSNPFLPSDPVLWSNPSGPLPPPSTDAVKWWQVSNGSAIGESAGTVSNSNGSLLD
ncbi:SacI homology domain-containing protein [Entophlyctis helioformis]|nr:SacI homology domain-containing protein [Entophlyctis helioformis]